MLNLTRYCPVGSNISNCLFYNNINVISDLKNTTSRCGWICRNRKIIDCTFKTIVAAAACGVSVVAIISGNYFVAGFVGVSCIISATAAINCWKNI